MSNIKLDITKAASFLEAGAVKAFEPKIKAAQEALENGTCPGNDFLGWLHLPSSITPAFIDEVQAVANTLREKCEVVVVAGIGGSYLGARAVIEALDEALLGDTDAAEAPASWPDLSAIDSLYLQLLANEPDVDRKSAIGHTRRAWLNYIDQLRQLLPTLPEKCRPAYLTIISRQASTFQTSLPTNHATQ